MRVTKRMLRTGPLFAMTRSVRSALLLATILDKREERVEGSDNRDSADAQGNRTQNGHDIHIGTANLIARIHQGAKPWRPLAKLNRYTRSMR